MKPRAIKTKLVKVEARSLRAHPTAQRALLPAKLKQLMANLDLDAIGVLHAVEYEINGEMAIWLIDGQHRWRALMDHGLGEWMVEVKVHVEVKDDARASELFLRLNHRAPVKPYDKFMNARNAGYVDAVGVSRIIQEHGLTINSSGHADRQVRCVGALVSIFNYDGGVTLQATLDTLIAAWGTVEAAMEGKLVEGLALVYKTYNGTVDRPAIVRKLSKYPGGPAGLMGDARGLRQYRHITVARCVAERMIDLYNTSRKTGRLDPL